MHPGPHSDLYVGADMTVFRFRSCSFWLLLSLSVSASNAQVLTEEPTSGGTFNAPGYITPGTPRGAQQPDGRGMVPGRGAMRTMPDGTPTLRTPFGDGVRRDSTVPEVRLRREMPPPIPSEFQRFVEAATGRLLPHFGASFFADALDTFAPVDNVPVSADYVVGPGDEVLIRAWGSIDVDYRTTVDRNGLLNLPRIGSFTVAGVKAADLERHLRAQIGRLYTNFNLNVSLGQLRAVKVFVVGPAQRAGVYTLSSQSTLLSAVVAAGGPGPNGSMRRIGLRRNGQIISELDVYEFLVQGDKSKDVQLAAGDVVVFHPAGSRVAIHGAIDTPAIYELKSRDEPLREVLRYAGGTPVLANPNRVQLERVDPTKQPAARFVEVFNLDGNGLQKPLRDGDLLTLLAISPQFANAVTLRGHVAQPLRYPHTPGMRIRDLIPDRDALVSPDFYRRKNLLVQIIEEEVDEFGRRIPSTLRPGERRDRFERGERSLDRSDRPNEAERTDRDRERNERDRVGVDRNDRLDRSDRADTRDGDPRRLRRDERDHDLVSPSGPQSVRRPPATLFDELNWDYAVIERLHPKELTTQVIPFNLGAAVLQGDPQHNIELMPGDVVTIYSQRDLRVPVAKQTRLVSLEGEVASAGVYQLLPGETLKQLIARVGGFTPHAYVYGLEFAREETRRRQQENLASAVQRLEALAATQAAREAANTRFDDPANRSTVVSSAATQAQLQRLRALRANGRIALELDYQQASFDALPDLPLEAGDRITVPARPGFVTVAGAVANNNAYLWKPGRTADDYLRLAGVEETAETSEMFILRADGTVTHAGDHRRGLFGIRGGIGKQELYPGDALIVPNQLDYETWGRALVRNLKDWSQIFYQFGLGAAAIVTLRNNN
jgi:polysaccharide biosynthesis/export protein